VLEGPRVVELGGLAVLGTERHESRRIDNQLRGRSGRQGDPGASRFYLSLEDDLLRRSAGGTLAKLMDRLRLPDETPISHRLVTDAIADAQRQVESWNFQRRRNVLRYDEVLDEQRTVVYGARRRILEGEQVRERVRGFLAGAVGDQVGRHCPRGAGPGDWDLRALFAELRTLYPVGVRQQDVDLERAGRAGLQGLLLGDADRAYQAREAEVGAERFTELQRRALLLLLDRHWREHLEEVDALQDVLWMLAIGQRDPLVEYRRRAVATFQAMQASLKRAVVTHVFNAPVQGG
jgi:preprotein translocase subunit SecA